MRFLAVAGTTTSRDSRPPSWAAGVSARRNHSVAGVAVAVVLTVAVIGCAPMRAVDSRTPSELAPDLVVFAAESLGVPPPARPPLVVQLDPAAMRDIAHTTGALDPCRTERRWEVHGLCALGRGVVMVSRSWRADRPTDVGWLLHELVHYVQDTAGVVYPCSAAAEADAYRVQRRFLEAAGLSFERTTGLTEADLEDMARCAPGGAGGQTGGRAGSG